MKFFILFFTLLVAFSSLAQRNYPNATMAVQSKNDYSITVKYSGAGAASCDDSPAHKLRWYSNGKYVSQNGGGHKHSGSRTYNVGPNNSSSYQIRYEEWEDCDWLWCNCVEWVWSNTITGRTDQIYAPKNVQASDKTSDQRITVTWEKGSAIPDSYLQYYIYRNNSRVAIVSGTSRSWTDNNAGSGNSYTYYVRTYTPSWGGHLSSAVSNSGSTWSVDATATKGEDGKIKVSWNNISTWVENIKIERSEDGVTYEEIDILDKNATTYSDSDPTVIAGYTYYYKITPIKANSTFNYSVATGNKLPDGTISGTVKTRFGAAVKGVTISASSIINENGVSKTFSYTGQTDETGFFEIKNIYYYKSAQFTVTPSKGNHGFDPESMQRTLDRNNKTISGLAFVDTTLLTVSGRIYFPPAETNAICGEKDVELMLDGAITTVKTDADGYYDMAIDKTGIHEIKPVFKGHTFSPSSLSINVTDYVEDADFVDTQKDTLIVKLEGGCGNVIADYATFDIFTANNCYRKTVTTNETGVYMTNLPAQEYMIELKEVYVEGNRNPNIETFFGTVEVVDLSQRDTLTEIVSDTVVTITPGDTTIIAGTDTIISPPDTTVQVNTDTIITDPVHQVYFTYHSNITVDVHDIPKSRSCNTFFLMEQNDVAILPIEVQESFIYKGITSTCHVDSGYVNIYDDVSGVGLVKMNLENGFAYYKTRVGDPNIAGGGAHPYQKLLQVEARVGYASPVTSENWVLVTGHKPRTQTFVTKTPELPLWILHDPPGDQSYSFVEKDSAISYSYTNQYQVGGGAGPYLDLKIGAGIPVPFTGIVIGAATHIEAKVEIGGSSQDKNSVTTTYKANRRFQTSGDETFVGNDGDIFVGASFNMIYALTDEVRLDENSCSIIRDTSLAWGDDGQATTFIYTEGHVKNVLLKQLKTLKRLSSGDSADLIQTYINVWEQTLAKNEENRENARFKENISFSAGSNIDNSVTTSHDTVMSIDYETYVNIETAIGAGIGDGGKFANTEFGVKANFKWNMHEVYDTNIVTSKTIGYHLEDNDIGDFFSVDVKEDKVYGTPVFDLVAGTSSCPNEKGSQVRDKLQINMDSYTANNVPANDKAVFTVNLSNISESEDDWNYTVRTITSSNPDGATIRLGGQVITGGSVDYFIPAGKTASVALTVEKGPVASDYEGLQVMMYSDCEYQNFLNGAALQNSDTISFNVHFQSECSSVEIYEPFNNFIVNQTDNDKLTVILTAYNPNNPIFEDLKIQLREKGKTWNTVAVIHKSLLTEKFFVYNVDVTNYRDGEYELRTISNCGNEGGVKYSETISGRIDRNSAMVLGIPEPADGILNLGDEIKAVFNETIDCDLQYDPVAITMTDENGDTIPASFYCGYQEVVINTEPVSLLDAYEGSPVTVKLSNLKDEFGNVIDQDLSWTFVVSRSELYFNPAYLNVETEYGKTKSFDVEVVNQKPAEVAFHIVDYPDWLTIEPLIDTIPASASKSVNLTVSDLLDVGIYNDTIVAEYGQILFPLPVTVDVRALPNGWNVDPSKYEHSMSIICQYSLTDQDAPLSADTRDMIGAFVNGECRGFAQIEFVSELNAYRAYLTVYGSKSFGENIEFSIWDAVPGIEYTAKESISLIADVNLGKNTAPLIFHSEGTIQNIPLNKGWNWISINGTNSDMSLQSLLKNYVGDTSSIIKSQTDFAGFSNTLGWTGPLSELNIKEGYMLYAAEADTLKVTGRIINDSVDVSLKKGWNWVGYLGRSKRAITDYLVSGDFSDEDILKGQTMFSQYDTLSNSWLGSLEYMEPGKGYKLFSNASGNLRLTSSNARFAAVAWEVKPENFESNMNMVIRVVGEGLSTNFLKLGAFSGDSCRGVAEKISMQGLPYPLFFLTIHGNQKPEDLTLRLLDTYEDTELVIGPDAISYGADKRLGNPDDPYIINVEPLGLNLPDKLNKFVGLFPNPSTGMVTLELSGFASDKIDILISDVVGHTVFAEKNVADFEFDFSDWAKGVYIISVLADGERSFVKMVLE